MAVDDDKTNLQPMGVGTPLTLRLRSLKSSRQSMARILRLRAKNQMDDDTFKSLVWGLSQYLGFLKQESTESIEARLTEIEKKLREAKK